MLFSLAVSPIFDGVLISVLTTNIIQDLRMAVLFGLTVFSGGGCIAAASIIENKFSSITKVYMVVGLLSILASILTPFFSSFVFPYFYVFTSAMLICMGMEFLGIKIGIKPIYILILGILLSMLHFLLILPVNIQVTLSSKAILFVGIAVTVGYFSTFLGSMVLGSFNLEKIKKFSGVCLIFLGIKILGISV